MTSRFILISALLLPSTAFADGWDVQPTRFRISNLVHEGAERGIVRTPTLSLLASGQYPLGIADGEDWDETAGGAAFRMELDVPFLTFLTVGGYAEAGWRRIWSEWEWDNVDFAVIDVGVHVRLRGTIGAMQFFVGGHTGMTRTRGHASIKTWHYGGHGGMRAGNRVGVVMLLGVTIRDWDGSLDTQWDESFEKPFAELFGSLGLSIVLGDYR